MHWNNIHNRSKMFSLWLILVRKMIKSPHKERRVALLNQTNLFWLSLSTWRTFDVLFVEPFVALGPLWWGSIFSTWSCSPSRLYRSAKQIKAWSQITFLRLLHNSRTRTRRGHHCKPAVISSWNLYLHVDLFPFLANATHSNHPYKGLMLFAIEDKQLFLYIFYRRTLQKFYFLSRV